MRIPRLPLCKVRSLHRLACLRTAVQILPATGMPQGELHGDPSVPPISQPEDSCSAPPSPPSSESPTKISTPLSILPGKLSYEFQTGISLFAKRPSPPFPPPFDSASPPSSEFRDAFRDFHFNQVHKQQMGSEKSDPDIGSSGSSTLSLADSLGHLRGISNGDDAVITSPSYLGVADGVGAWNTRPQGNAALWSRLILHFWAMQIDQQLLNFSDNSCTSTKAENSSSQNPPLPDPLEALQRSYETLNSLTTPFPYLGTTTACLALLLPGSDTLLLTNVGDSQAFVLRPSVGAFIARTEEQWHWFDCPRQLGTNSPDTPIGVGTMQSVKVEEGDVVVVATDGLMDNLWESEVVGEMMTCLTSAGEDGNTGGQTEMDDGVPQNIADRLVEKAKSVAGDPWGLSPYMERAVEQGLGVQGGKWDDITVSVGRCVKRRKS